MRPNFSIALIFSYVGRSLKFRPDTISHKTLCRRPNFGKLIGPLTIELSTEVNCLRDSPTISIRPPSPRQVCDGKCVALRYSCRSRRIVIISFSPENGVRFDASCLSHGADKYINSEVCIPFYRIVSRNFHLKAFSWY